MAAYTAKVVIVTGASSGIGAGTAVAYAKQGAKLVLGGRNEENLNKTRKACQEQGTPADNILLVRGDLTKEADCNAIIDNAVDKFRCIDILINNAGSLVHGNMGVATVDDMDHMYNTHVRSMFMMTKRVIPHLEKTKGSIVNVSSLAGTSPMPSVMAYGIAKAAVCHLTQTVAQDVAAKGIRVNCIAPGVIETDIFIRSGRLIERAPEKIAEFWMEGASLHPLQRVGQVEEVAGTILYLTSEAAGFVTGAILPIDGGRHGTCSVRKPQSEYQ